MINTYLRHVLAGNKQYFYALFLSVLYEPRCRWLRTHSSPIDTAGKPMPIRLIEHKNFILTGWPNEATLMQTAYAQPDAGAIPDQQFNPVAIFIAKGVGIAIAGWLAQTLLHM